MGGRGGSILSLMPAYRKQGKLETSLSQRKETKEEGRERKEGQGKGVEKQVQSIQVSPKARTTYKTLVLLLKLSV